MTLQPKSFNIDISIEGDYSFDKVGTYKLYYVAKDSSGNVCKKEFTLEVEDSNMVGNNTDNIIEFIVLIVIIELRIKKVPGLKNMMNEVISKVFNSAG